MKKWQCTRCDKLVVYQDVYLVLKADKCVCVKCYGGLKQEIKNITRINYDEE